jgi:phage gpG-like protein
MRMDVDISEVLPAIDGMLSRLRDQRPAWDDIGWMLRSSVAQNFASEGRPEKWRRLSSATMWRKLGGKRKAIKGKWVKTKDGWRKAKAGRKVGFRAAAKKTWHENKILTDTSQLRNSITHKADATGVTVGTNMVYAAIHQFGGQAGRDLKTTIPARPYLVVQDEDYDRIVRIIERHLSEGWK